MNEVSETRSASGDVTFWQVSAKRRTGDAIVLSHSCELDRANVGKVGSVVLAPLRDVRRAGPEEMVSELVAQGFRSDEAKPQFYKFCYVAPNGNLQHSAGAVVDLPRCYNLGVTYYDQLLKSKLLQLDPSAMEAFALRVALYFYRAAG